MPKPPKQNDKPYVLKCGHCVGYIHSDASGVTYLGVISESGIFAIYGPARIYCQCGREGRWEPGAQALEKLLATYRDGHTRLAALVEELKQIV